MRLEKAAALLLFFVLYLPSVRWGWVIDDYFFHGHLQSMSVWRGLEQRLTENWNFEFMQAPMYRPVAGIVQVLAHWTLGVEGHRVLSLILHATACGLAAGLAPVAARGLVFGALLLQPWALESVVWSFSFYDPLAQVFLLLALRAAGRPGWRLLALGLALGCKETMLPQALIVGLLLARETSWRKAGLVLVPLALFVLARWLALGSALGSSDGSSMARASGAALPLAWDGLLVLVGCGLGWLASLRKENEGWAWCAPWAALAILPAVHFSVQTSGSPIPLSPRYWYSAVFPMTLAFSALFVRWLGGRPGLKLLGFVLLLALSEKRLIRQAHRAEEARSVLDEFRPLSAQPAACAVLGLSEALTEPNVGFNGDLEWALGPPFLENDVNARLYCSYPRWDRPPTNRYADLHAEDLVARLLRGESVAVYRWSSRKLQSLGLRSLDPLVSPPPLDAPETQAGALVYRTRFNPLCVQAILLDLAAMDGSLELGWRGESHSWTTPVANQPEPKPCRLWIPLGRQVDWLFAGELSELRLSGSGLASVRGLRLVGWSEPLPPAAEASPLYLAPSRRFIVLQNRFRL